MASGHGVFYQSEQPVYQGGVKMDLYHRGAFDVPYDVAGNKKETQDPACNVDHLF